MGRGEDVIWGMFDGFWGDIRYLVFMAMSIALELSHFSIKLKFFSICPDRVVPDWSMAPK